MPAKQVSNKCVIHQMLSLKLKFYYLIYRASENVRIYVNNCTRYHIEKKNHFQNDCDLIIVCDKPVNTFQTG